MTMWSSCHNSQKNRSTFTEWKCLWIFIWIVHWVFSKQRAVTEKKKKNIIKATKNQDMAAKIEYDPRV